MSISGLLTLFDQLPGYDQLVTNLRAGKLAASPLGLQRSARPALLAALMRDLDRPLLLITSQNERASSLTSSLRAWSPTPERVLRLPELLSTFYERAPWSRDVVAGRLHILSGLASQNGPFIPSGPPVVVASARSLMQPTMPRRQFRMGTRTLRPGQLLDMERTLAVWVGLGYRSTPVVEVPGEFSRRGGILDIYPPASLAPIRIELFGDEIESLRHFDPATQRSERRLEQAVITPATEALPRFGPRVAEQLAGWDLEALSQDEAEPFRQDREALVTGSTFKGIEFYLPLLYTHPESLLDYFPEEGLAIVEDQEELASAWLELERQAQETFQEAHELKLLPPGYPQPYIDWEDWLEKMQSRTTLELGYGEASPGQTGSPLARAFNPGPRFGGQLKPLLGHIRAALAADEQLVVVSRQARRLAELWSQEDEYISPLAALTELPQSPLTFVQEALAEGWSSHVPAGQDVAVWHLLTDAEIFGWARPQPRRRKPRKVAPEKFFADLKPGDYVVHIEHGIGLFRGLTNLSLGDVAREYLLVQYDAGGKVFVPIHQADRLSRYVGAEDQPPALNRLGTADWNRVRKQAQQAAEEVATDLLELYAAREMVVGHAFGPDTPWQAELEATFPYIETEDQLRAIEEVKGDMENPQPMDRLICGDVGYGKTEVALRAAFKAVMDGKQVAVLVPTTVLAQQHYNTFRDRLRPFPVEVEMLSRFRTAKQQDRVLKRLSQGQTDIVIGTHRLLSQDVSFKDLGLLIVDEEQRFGVVHKERMKQLRTRVDVLTMTATPIPRTLYMSLVGARDISTIDTPPEERLPVSTYVGRYEDDIVRHAILREIDRGGQVFFVHNRVQGLEQVRRRLEQIVPEAVFATAHGQMNERGLERAMLRFVNGEIDALLTTSIIESGLDIPNANTLIVNRADRFGLAQLYQLRGRVGRGAQRAYAYFFYNNPRHLTDDARRRLDTIREATGLGDGYTIAMRDLEIRGAGDILGTRQHGHISAVGFDLYTRLLAQAVREKQAEETGEAFAPALPPLVTIDLPLPVHIPAEYVPDVSLRLRLYRRLAQMTTLSEIDAIAEELADRFGPIPDEVDNLLYQLRLKVLAGATGVETIGIENGKLAIRSPNVEQIGRLQAQRRLGRDVRVSRQSMWLPYSDVPEQKWRVQLVQALEMLAEL
jgi:transcription-repair coupling factor (superfamily II helicase)